MPVSRALSRLLRRVAATQPPRVRVRMKLEEIEPRILHSADLMPGVPPGTENPAFEMRLVETAAPAAAARPVAQESRSHELVIVDTAAEGYEQLVADILAQGSGTRAFDVLVLDGTRDGLTQISEALAQRQDLDAVHVISHGSAGGIRLGADLVDSRALDARAAEIGLWSRALAPEADFLLYGCDVAASPDGKAFVDALSRLTGADVAGSDDVTGYAGLGGNWVLEYQAGSVETGLALSAAAQSGWQGTLAMDVVRASYDVAMSELENTGFELKSGQSWGQTFTHDSANPTYEIDKIALVLSRASDAPAGQTITVSLRSTWGGPVIASGTVSSNTLGTSESWVTVNLASSATLTDNATYFIRVDSNGSAKVYLGVDSSSAAPGNLIDHGGSAQSGKDMAFRAIDSVTTLAAPVLPDSNDLATIAEDAVANDGTSVRALIAGYVTDADAGAPSGIAVTAVDGTNGTWQYSTDNRGSWSAFGTIDATTVRLLAADDNTYVRFVPNANWNGVVGSGITFRAWDQSMGTAGATFNANAVQLNVLDDFASASYAINEGTALWATSWSDSEDASASSGQIRVSSGKLSFDGSDGSTSSITREVNLAGATSATLSYAYTNNAGSADVKLEVWNGAWHQLDHSDALASSGTRTHTITGYAAANTRIRFTVDGNAGGLFGIGAGGTFTADNINVAYTGAYTGGTTAFSAATATSGVTVTAVNDAPTLSGAANLTGINEDPAGNAGTLVSALIPTQVGDIDAGSVRGIAVTAVDDTNGTWQYSTNAGGAWASFGSVSAASARLLAADANTYVRFVPHANWNGTVANGLTFRAWDTTTGSNGGVAWTIPNPVFTDNFNAVAFNNSNGTVSWNGDWVESEGDGPGSGKIRVDAGRLELRSNGAGETLHRSVNLAGATSATLTFSYDNQWTAAGATMLVQVSANGGAYTTLPGGTFTNALNSGLNTFSADLTPYISADTRIRFNITASGSPPKDLLIDNVSISTVAAGSGGTSAYSAATASSGITVATVNDAPAGSSNTLTINEDAPLPFTTAHFGFADPVEGNALAGVKITTLPASGALLLNGVAVSAGQVVSAADIAASKLVFTPVANANGAGYGNFTFQVEDDGGTANGGVNLDPVARTMTVNVTSVNDAPSGTSATVTTLEDTAVTLRAVNFGFSDAADGNSFAAVRISSLPFAGTLRLNGVAVTSGQTIAIADIDADRLVYTPGSNGNGASYASFTFQVQDDGGTANGGVNLDASPNTITFNVTPVNDAPRGTSITVVATEDVTGVFNTSLFGFYDPGDSPDNNFTAVKITTTVTAGSLTYNGVAVVAGQVISAADIDAGLLRFRAAANANGNAYTSLTFQVQDDGGTANGGVDLDATPRTMTIDVTSVNDAPVGADKTVTTAEDTAFTFAVGDFGFSDPNDTPGNSMSSVQITTLATAGSLTLNGVAVTAGQFITVASINAGNLRFTPAANANGAGYASFTFQVRDNGGTSNGGDNLDDVARTMTVDVTPVGDAPVGTAATVVATEDLPYTFSAADFGYTDPVDGGAHALQAVRITTLASAGTLALNGVAVTAGQFVSVADIGLGLLTFTPGANGTGAGYASFTFQVQDDGGGANLDTTARAMTINVTAVNDAPVGTDTTVGIDENGTLVLRAGAFGFTDPADAPGNNLLAVRIVSLPVAGTLTLSGIAVSAGQVIAAADLAAGLLAYTPVPGTSGVGYASLTFRVQDDGGGADTDAVARTLTIDVGPINHAPVGTSKTITTSEETAHVFITADFGFSDPNDAQASNLLAVRITTLPAVGTLTLNSGAVNAGDFVSAADIAGGLLVYTPAANANGVGYASFTFQVQDDGGTAAGGVDLDGIARTMTVDVTAVNDAPTGADATLALTEDVAHVFGTAEFGFTDAADAGANALKAVRIGAIAGGGTLRLNGIAVTAGQSIDAADIAAGKLVFTPLANANGANYASFTFQVQDDGGTAGAGVDLDLTARTITLDVAAVNDRPTGASGTVSVLEDGSYTFLASDFGYGDAADTPAHNFAAVTITSAPLAGTLKLNGFAVGDGDSISVADIVAGRLVYAPAANANGATYASFTFQVQDDGGGADLDSVARTMTIAVTPVNDAPAGTNNRFTLAEDATHVFTAGHFGFSDAADSNAFDAVRVTTLPSAGSLTLNGAAVVSGQWVSAADIAAGRFVYAPVANENGANYTTFTFEVRDDGGTADGGDDTDTVARTITFDVTSVNDAPAGTDTSVGTFENGTLVLTRAAFGFTDPADNPGNSLLAVRITALPATGALTLGGVAVTAGQVVAAADIDAGLLLYRPVANTSGTGYAAFTFKVTDDGGGSDTDTVARTLTIDVGAINHAPRGTDNTILATEDTPYVFIAADFGFADPNDPIAGNLSAVKITTLPPAGALELHGVAVTAGQLVSAADIAGGALVFTPAADQHGGAYAAFTFQVQDDGGTANGGTDLDATARTMTIDVASVNDAPSGSGTTIQMAEDGARVLGAIDFGYTDATDGPSNAFAGIRITAIAGGGALTLNGAAVAVGQTIGAADIAAGRLVYTPGANAAAAGYASFDFRVRDDGGTANGGIDLDILARTITFDVTSVNDAPTGAARTVTALEDGAYVFATADFGFSDANDAPGNVLAGVRIASLPLAGALSLDGIAVSAGQVVAAADIAAGKLVFTPVSNANGTAYAAFTFQVQDNGGGTDLDPVARTMTVDVTAVNDAPSGASATLTLAEDTTRVLTVADFGFSDGVDGTAHALNRVRITAIAGDGALTLNGVAVVAGQSIRASDIAAGGLVFTPGANANGAGYASFDFRVIDTGGSANGGVNIDAITRTMTFDVTAVNDAPAGVSRTVTVLEDGAHVFAAADFGFSDALDTPAGSLAAVRVGALTGAAVLSLNGTAVTAGQLVSVADIDAGRLVYRPAANAHGAAYGQFSFNAVDNGSGDNSDPVARTMTLDVTSVNDTPVGQGGSVSMVAGNSHVLGAASFGFSDPGDTPADRLLAVRIATLPGGGTLTVNGVAVTAGQYISAADIDAGKLVFHASSAGAATFTFQVQDDGAGSALDAVARTVTFNVSAPPRQEIVQAPVPEPVFVPAPVNETRVQNSTTSSVASSTGASSGSSSSTSSTSSSSGGGSGTASTSTSGQTTGSTSTAAAPAGTGSTESAAGEGTAEGGSDRAAGAGGAAAPDAAEGSSPRAPVAGDDTRGAVSTTAAAAAAQGQVNVLRPDAVQVLKDVREGVALVPVDSQALAQMQTGGLGGGSLLLAQQSQSSSAAALATPEARALGRELDQLRDSMKDQTRLESATVAATAATGMSLSVGYVVWLLRGGALLSTFLSSLPAWRFIDPLPVLGRMDGDDGDDDDDSLESMVATSDETPDNTNGGEPGFPSVTALPSASTDAAPTAGEQQGTPS